MLFNCLEWVRLLLLRALRCILTHISGYHQNLRRGVIYIPVNVAYTSLPLQNDTTTAHDHRVGVRVITVFALFSL